MHAEERAYAYVTGSHHSWDDPGGAGRRAKEELLALQLSPDLYYECGICDRDYMLRRGCPCRRD